MFRYKTNKSQLGLGRKAVAAIYSIIIQKVIYGRWQVEEATIKLRRVYVSFNAHRKCRE